MLGSADLFDGQQRAADMQCMGDDAVGFLGAGAILKQTDKNDIRGLTTAASVWLTSAVGIAAGMGREATAVVSAMFGLVVLSILRAQKK